MLLLCYAINTVKSAHASTGRLTDYQSLLSTA